MSRRLVIITEIISPYRIPLFNCLAAHAEIDLHVIFLAETDPVLRKWSVLKSEIRFSYEVLPSWRFRIGGANVLLNRRVIQSLEKSSPDFILCGGYNYPASWQALFWARRHGLPFALWSESNAQDQRGGSVVVESLKRYFLRKCDEFAVPGQAATDYLLGLGIDRTQIFMAVNAVDNNFFLQRSQSSRRNAAKLRSEFNLPERYFLFAGRLVREKGIFELLRAYATLDDTVRGHVGLVFAGDGPSRSEAEREASKISGGLIRFLGFAQRERLADCYALAEMLVLPTYTDTWGLVVNEAMACGLPIITTNVAGCARDLIIEDWNGRIVPVKDVTSLSRAMSEMAKDRAKATLMGKNSADRIQQFTPEEWSSGILKMVSSPRFVRG